MFLPYNESMNTCDCNTKPCNSCVPQCSRCDTPCDFPAPFLGIEQVPNNISVLRFNIDGKRTDYDFKNLIYTVQSETTLVADAINRLLRYQAERHQDTITAQELGAILHLADIGDVNTNGAESGSMLVYQKGTNCADGCIGLRDSWKVWNALDEQVSSATYPFAFAADGTAHTLQRPANPEQYYQLGWNGSNQLSYSQVPTVAAAKPNGNGKKLAVYLDPNTKQLVAVEQD